MLSIAAANLPLLRQREREGGLRLTDDDRTALQIRLLRSRVSQPLSLSLGARLCARSPDPQGSSARDEYRRPKGRERRLAIKAFMFELRRFVSRRLGCLCRGREDACADGDESSWSGSCVAVCIRGSCLLTQSFPRIASLAQGVCGRLSLLYISLSLSL